GGRFGHLSSTVGWVGYVWFQPLPPFSFSPPWSLLMMGSSHAATGLAVGGVVLAGLSWAGAPIGFADVVFGGMVCAGAALLPDLDHPTSTATLSQGPVSAAASRGVRALSSRVWRATRTPWDRGGRDGDGGHRRLSQTVPASGGGGWGGVGWGRRAAGGGPTGCVAPGSRGRRVRCCGGRGGTVVACPGPCRVGRVLVGWARSGGVLAGPPVGVGRGERCRAVVDDRGVRVRGGAAGGRGHGGLGDGGARARGCVDGGGGAARVAVAGAGREVADGGCAAQVSHGPGECPRVCDPLGGVGCDSGVGAGRVAVTGSGVVHRRLVGAWRAGVGWENEGESPVRRFPSSSL